MDWLHLLQWLRDLRHVVRCDSLRYSRTVYTQITLCIRTVWSESYSVRYNILYIEPGSFELSADTLALRSDCAEDCADLELQYPDMSDMTLSLESLHIWSKFYCINSSEYDLCPLHGRRCGRGLVVGFCIYLFSPPRYSHMGETPRRVYDLCRSQWRISILRA